MLYYVDPFCVHIFFLMTSTHQKKTQKQGSALWRIGCGRWRGRDFHMFFVQQRHDAKARVEPSRNPRMATEAGRLHQERHRSVGGHNKKPAVEPDGLDDTINVYVAVDIASYKNVVIFCNMNMIIQFDCTNTYKYNNNIIDCTILTCICQTAAWLDSWACFLYSLTLLDFMYSVSHALEESQLPGRAKVRPLR